MKLCIFGSLLQMFDTTPNRIRLAPRSLNHIQLNFDDRIKGYCCFNFIFNKVIMSKDVQFLKTYDILNCDTHILPTTQVSRPSLVDLLVLSNQTSKEPTTLIPHLELMDRISPQKESNLLDPILEPNDLSLPTQPPSKPITY